MFKSQLEFLHHINDECAFLIRVSSKNSKTVFFDDEVLQRACVRSLEVIGEAVKKLDMPYRESHSSVEWKAIAGMRDILIHHYMGVDYELVWDVIENQIPNLKVKVEGLLKELA